MRWANPDALALLWLTPALVAVYVYAFRARRRALETLAFADALPGLVSRREWRQRRLRAGLMVAGLVLLVIAVARPQVGAKMTKVKRKGVDVIVAIDTSESMLARDVAPNRLEAAKDAVRGLLGRLRGDRVGIVAFAGDAFVYCPLTVDYGAAAMFLDSLDTQVIGLQGTAIAKAITCADDAFKAAEHKYKQLVIMTDGEDHEGGELAAAKRAAEDGVQIHVIGVGGLEGEPIPIEDEAGKVTGHKRDRNGDIVLSRLHEQALKKIAEAGGGVYMRASATGVNVDRIYAQIEAPEGQVVGTYRFTEYQERYQWPLGLALILLAAQILIGDNGEQDARSRDWERKAGSER